MMVGAVISCAAVVAVNAFGGIDLVLGGLAIVGGYLTPIVALVFYTNTFSLELRESGQRFHATLVGSMAILGLGLYDDIRGAGALQKLLAAADVTGTTLYQASMRCYKLLRYGVEVQVAVGRSFETVHLIDWAQPDSNDFALAEEVTLKGGHERRPDVVLYLNGIAIGVMEFKRGSVEVADGIRQLILTLNNSYNLPIKGPVKNLRPARETCEGCHNPLSFADNIIKTKIFKKKQKLALLAFGLRQRMMCFTTAISLSKVKSYGH